MTSIGSEETSKMKMVDAHVRCRKIRCPAPDINITSTH